MSPTSMTLNDNFIEINASEDMDLSKVHLYGSSNLYANTLMINGAKNLKLGQINKFQSLSFRSIYWQKDGTAISVASDAHFKNISIEKSAGFLLAENQSIAAGDSMTLVEATSPEAFSYDLVLPEHPTDTVYTQANVGRKISGNIVKSNDGKSLDFVVKDVELAEQTFLLAENRAVTAAFLNEGSDAALKALVIPEELHGFSLFATSEGSASEYDVNDSLKINGWHFAVGTHGTTTVSGNSNLRAALYFEHGTGNYRTFNSFNEEFFRGDGEVSYADVGLAAKYSLDNGWYAEGSLRAGELKTEMNKAVRNAQGKLLGYDSESFYWGGHIGTGKVMKNSSMKLDVYGRFYWTEVSGDGFSLGGDRFTFGDISSQRVRIGSRIESVDWGFYFGTAYENEFDGDASMSVADIDAPVESLKGNSFMGEIGWMHRFSTIPCTIDLRTAGWTGERSGVSGQVYIDYEF